MIVKFWYGGKPDGEDIGEKEWREMGENRDSELPVHFYQEDKGRIEVVAIEKMNSIEGFFVLFCF